MAAYAQFGYSYPSANQIMVGQTTTTQTISASTQSPISGANTNPPSLSPGGSGSVTGTQSNNGAMSPGASSQTSQSAGPTTCQSSIGGSGANNNISSPCCENGRPVMTDPVSGQTVCSCQYDSARLALSGYSRLSSTGVGVYGTPYPSTEQNPYPSIGVDSSAFYSPLNNPYGLKDSGPTTEMSAWTSAGLQPTTGYYPYDPALAAYSYGAGYDLAARRKNATRESTATLKAWLNEHKKNPYPTKGEKIMLAIITKMTLTQVSTWFANARRRLKKENKMTWEPKNKTEEDDDAMVSDDDRDKDTVDDKNTESKDSLHHVKSEHTNKDDQDEEDDYNDHKLDMMSYQKNFQSNNPYYQNPMLSTIGGPYGNIQHHNLKSEIDNMSKNQSSSDCGVPIPASKPKIWSLADTAACKTPPHQNPWIYPPDQASSYGHPSMANPMTPHSHLGHHQQQNQNLHHEQNPAHHHQSHQAAMMEGGMEMNTTIGTSLNMNPDNYNQPLNAMSNMSGMMNTFGNDSPYNRYGGFLGYTSTGIHPQNVYMNNNRSGGTVTPLTPNSACQSTTPTLQQSHSQSQQNNQVVGFPEIQTDTPPQTPPNMKLPSVVGNLITNSQHPKSENVNYSNNGGANSSNSDNYRGNNSPSNRHQVIQNQVPNSGFKPFYKNSPKSNYVSPV